MTKTTVEEREILKAKAVLEEEISEIMCGLVESFHERYPDWLVTDADLGIIDVSTFAEQQRGIGSARVELTKKDGSVTVKKGGQVKKEAG